MTGIVGRDRAREMVLLGGFGVGGIGTMWSPAADYMKTLPVWQRITRPGVIGFEATTLTYDTAPELPCPDALVYTWPADYADYSQADYDLDQRDEQ